MKYAQFDPSAIVWPTPVVGWYHVQDENDPDGIDYPALPETRLLLAVDDTTWANRIGAAYGVDGSHSPPSFVILPPLPPTPAAVAGAKLAAGAAVTSTATPTLDGTYALGPAAQQMISSVAAGIAARNRVPGGGATFEYKDASGAAHSFTAQQFLDFASAIEDYVYAVVNGGSPTLPLTIP
jgi:hypothetical protein